MNVIYLNHNHDEYFYFFKIFVFVHSMVAGIPAKVIGYVAEQDPSLTMKHGMFRFSRKKAFDIFSFYILTHALSSCRCYQRLF